MSNIHHNPLFHTIATMRAIGSKNPMKELREARRKIKRLRRQIRTGR